MSLLDTVLKAPSSGSEPFTERRSSEARCASHGLTSEMWHLELYRADALSRLAPDIRALQARALDGNNFLRPEVLSASWPRLSPLLTPRGMHYACLYEVIGRDRLLRLFTPLRVTKARFGKQTVLQTLATEYGPDGTVLIDANVADEAAEHFLRLLPSPELGNHNLLELSWQKVDSETFRALQRAVHRLGLAHERTAQLQRAALRRPSDETAADPIRQMIGKKRRKEYQRLLNRLSDHGKVTFERSRNGERILKTLEEFLRLESRGWKGGRGSGLYNNKHTIAYARQMIYELSDAKACEMFALKLDDKSIAALIVLGTGGYLDTWKIVYDEAYAAYSPGVQIMLHTTSELLARPGFVEADSLAAPDHPMINHIWRDRLSLTDLTVALHSEAGPALEKRVDEKVRMERAKAMVKGMIARLR